MHKEGYYLDHFFSFMKANNIRFCVMNNYHGYPEVIPSDVDISIEKDTFRILDKLISTFAEIEKLVVVQKIWHGFKKCAYILSPEKIDKRFFLQLDFFVDFTAKGYLKLISSSEMISTSQPYKNFFIPSLPVEVVFLVMRRIIKNDASESKVAEVKKLFNQSPDMLSQIGDIFGNNMKELVDSFVTLKYPDDFTSNNKHFVSNLKLFAKRRSTISYRVTYYLIEIRRLLSRIRYPVGLSVCFLSPDGGGKSTALNNVTPMISGVFHGCSHYYWRPGLLPPMGRLKFWNPSPEIDMNPNPHDHPPQNLIKSFVRFFYYCLDYMFGYYLKIKPQTIKKKIVFFDRYYFDFLVDLHRYKMSIPKFVPKVVSLLIPSPDVTIVLSCDPEIMIQRKQEISITELTKQHKMYMDLAHRFNKFHIVDATNSEQIVAEEISVILIREKAKITKKSLQIFA